jgi:serine/threonine protein phosphatase PrpC
VNVSSANALNTCGDYFRVRYGDDAGATRSLYQFAILASDGLWDVISNADAVAVVCEFLSLQLGAGTSVEAYQNVATLLAQEAYIRGSTDNIGVCVVDLTQRPNNNDDRTEAV